MRLTAFASIACSGLLGVLDVASAAVIDAASCSQADVQSAIDRAQDGDTVIIPPGECTWTAPVTIGRVASWNPPIVYEGKNITLRGAAVDRTIIRGEIDSSRDLLSIIAQGDKPFRVTALTIKGLKNIGRCQSAITVGGEAREWRIDHVKIDYRDITTASPGCGILATGVGVVDHCSFENVYTALRTVGDGDKSWARPLALGSKEAVYFEDNVINNTKIVGDGATDAYGGARYVFRHNTVTNARAGHHGLDSGGYRSPHSFEIYENSFTWTVPNSWYSWRSRGGTGVIFNNTITGEANAAATFGVVNYRTCCCHWCTNVQPAAYGARCNPFTACVSPLHTNCGTWGRCDGTAPLDGNLDATGYPCRDQTGRSTDTNGDGIQDLEPLYEWGNTVNTKNADVTVNDPWGCTNPSMNDHIKEGRDFYLDTPRPGYTPYTYPHPLTTAPPPGDTTSPARPERLRVQ